MAKTEQGNGLEIRGDAEKLTDEKGTSGSEPEANGFIPGEDRQVDKYGFTGGAQQSSGEK